MLYGQAATFSNFRQVRRFWVVALAHTVIGVRNMEGLPEFKDHLANNFLSTVHPFDRRLVATGSTYRGHPTFNIKVKVPGRLFTLWVYRHKPLGLTKPVLEFVPEN